MIDAFPQPSGPGLVVRLRLSAIGNRCSDVDSAPEDRGTDRAAHFTARCAPFTRRWEGGPRLIVAKSPLHSFGREVGT